MKARQELARPIFVVGLPRTGSTLMRNIVNNNRFANYHIANEIQFFGHSLFGRILQGRRGIMPIIQASKDGSGRIHWEPVVDELYSGKAKGVHWNGLSAGWLNIPKPKLLASLSRTDGSPKAVFEAILATQEREYSGYGDKSCPNLYFMSTLLEWFPDCKIIQIIRDPRAILMSQYKRLISAYEHKDKSSGVIKSTKRIVYGGMIVTYILTYWGYAIRVDRQFSKSHPDNYMLVQYENLVRNPHETTKRICEFLSVEWDEQMITPPQLGSSYTIADQKGEHGKGMDREALERWRRHMPLWMRCAVKIHGALSYRRVLQEFGYLDWARQ